MARWKLMAAHYINVKTPWGETQKWVREEQNQETGRILRTEYNVPTLLDPLNDRTVLGPTGDCIVARPGSQQSGDWIYEGPPTADMEPLDDEARAISDSLRHKWVHPIDSLPTNGEIYSDKLIQQMERLIATPQPPVVLGNVNADEFEALKAQVAALMERNAMLEQQAAEAEEPLPEPELELEPSRGRR